MTIISAITPYFGYEVNFPKICVAPKGLHALQALGTRLTTEPNADPARGLVAVYVTGRVEARFDSLPSSHGRIPALVRLLPMPAGRSVLNYGANYMDLDKHGQPFDRWPGGWPSEVVFLSPKDGPVFRHSCLAAPGGPYDFDALTHAMHHHGPVDLEVPRFRPLAQYLLNEILYRAKQDPRTRARPF